MNLISKIQQTETEARKVFLQEYKEILLRVDDPRPTDEARLCELMELFSRGPADLEKDLLTFQAEDEFLAAVKAADDPTLGTRIMAAENAQRDYVAETAKIMAERQAEETRLERELNALKRVGPNGDGARRQLTALRNQELFSGVKPLSAREARQKAMAACAEAVIRANEESRNRPSCRVKPEDEAVVFGDASGPKFTKFIPAIGKPRPVDDEDWEAEADQREREQLRDLESRIDSLTEEERFLMYRLKGEIEIRDARAAELAEPLTL